MFYNYLKIKKIIFVLFFFSSGILNAATYIVDNILDTDNLAAYTANDGTNSLRKCIRLANANANSPTIDIINFNNLTGTGPFIIALGAALPVVSEPVYIDGFTAPSSVAPTPNVVIRAGGAGGPTVPNAFNLNAGALNSTIRGFTIYRFQNDGIYISGATNVTVEGCRIGLTETGTLPGVNNKVEGHGIFIVAGANNAKIGNATTAGRNVISGTLGHGVVVVNSTGATFKNNYIGTNVAGTAAIANNFHGINIDGSTGAVIGGAAANEGNLISGNSQSGIILANASSNAVIKGNKVGTNTAGIAAIANGESGINIFTNVLNTVIGGPLSGEGNILSGNNLSGINIADNSHNSVIKGNLIGLNVTGTAAVANLQHGIYMNNSNGATIGGPSKGQRNIVSGNGNAAAENGIAILNCNDIFIKGNFVGTDITGLAKIPNYDTGLSITNSTGDSIGGQTTMERNVFSGNGNASLATSGHGIYLSNVDNSRFYGNYIGTDSTGLAVLGNRQHGVYSANGSDNIYWYNNVISGNTQQGMNILSSSNNYFYGNFIGLGINGTSKVANNSNGVRIGNGGTGGSTNMVIGGTGVGQRNYISGNGNGTVPAVGSHGFNIDGGSTNISFKNNYIGSDITGMVAIGNSGAGIMFLDAANNNSVGGALAGEGNLICCSTGDHGVRINISNGNTIYGNLIGVNAAQIPAAGFGNNQYGVFMVSYSSGLPATSNSNVIGGLGALSNTIANNGSDGVNVFNTGGTSSNFNPIIGNKIYCNGGLGINRQTNSATENQGILAPVVTSSTANVVSGTGANGNTIHIYRNQYSDGARCDCEGEIYVGSTTVASGAWTFTHNLGLTAAQALSVTATQTNATNSTSEFWVCSVPMPVEIIQLKATVYSGHNTLSFSVAKEENIYLYTILKSSDGVNFEPIGSVIPNNHYNGFASYTFDDVHPIAGVNYYRIQVVERAGTTTHSKIVSVNTEALNGFIFPNPATDEVTVISPEVMSRVEIYTTLGQLVSDITIQATEITLPLHNFISGIYFLKIYEGEVLSKIYKLEKK